jgi:hypothetical protein
LDHAYLNPAGEYVQAHLAATPKETRSHLTRDFEKLLTDYEAGLGPRFAGSSAPDNQEFDDREFFCQIAQHLQKQSDFDFKAYYRVQQNRRKIRALVWGPQALHGIRGLIRRLVKLTCLILFFAIAPSAESWQSFAHVILTRLLSDAIACHHACIRFGKDCFANAFPIEGNRLGSRCTCFPNQ